MASLEFRHVTLDLQGFQLGETLKSMGMSAAFGSAADFSGMGGRSRLAGDPGCLYIREVVHKFFLSVDEASTEAASAIAATMQATSAPRTLSASM